MRILPYTYLLQNKTHWYIGVRVANKVPAFEDTEYMSSSDYIKDMIKQGIEFDKIIISEYATNEEACTAELNMLNEYWDIPGRINKARASPYKMDEDLRAKHRDACVKAQNRPEVRAKNSESQKKAQAKPEVRAKRKASQLATFAKPEVKAQRSLAQFEAQNRPEVQIKKRKQCTIDGITIYPSVSALIEALGQGKFGYTSPNFKYV